MDRFPIGLLIGVIKNVNKLKWANRDVPRESLLKFDLKVTDPAYRQNVMLMLWRFDQPQRFINHFLSGTKLFNALSKSRSCLMPKQV